MCYALILKLQPHACFTVSAQVHFVRFQTMLAVSRQLQVYCNFCWYFIFCSVEYKTFFYIKKKKDLKRFLKRQLNVINISAIKLSVHIKALNLRFNVTNCVNWIHKIIRYQLHPTESNQIEYQGRFCDIFIHI